MQGAVQSISEAVFVRCQRNARLYLLVKADGGNTSLRLGCLAGVGGKGTRQAFFHANPSSDLRVCLAWVFLSENLSPCISWPLSLDCHNNSNMIWKNTETSSSSELLEAGNAD